VIEASTHGDRVEAVKLAMLDALQWTEPHELAFASDAFKEMRHGIELLRQSTFSEGEEEEWLVSLVETGWNLAPATSPAAIPNPGSREGKQ
jgi:hypothetical protein